MHRGPFKVEYLENRSDEKMHVTEQFLWAKDFSAAEIHYQVEEVYGPQVMSIVFQSGALNSQQDMHHCQMNGTVAD